MFTKLILIIGEISAFSLLLTMPLKAQVTSDGTVSTKVENIDNKDFTITDGKRAGNNLFHSFEEFSVPNGGSASFNNASNIENILSRVTGNSISNIDGLIKANGSANFFLINPNGIIFGANARLDVGGSFLATTADSINFPDSKFSATNTQTEPLLSVNVPIGLQFGERSGRIINRSQATRFFPNFGDVPVGLTVQPGKTLALVGSNLSIDNGALFAFGGRIELGSVGSFSSVDITQIGEGYALGYDRVREFQDIQLSQAFVDTSDPSNNTPSGDIQLYGRAIAINDSELASINSANNPGGTLSIEASEALSVSNSFLSIGTVSSETAGDIKIKTKQLLVSDSSNINASSDGEGKGGNITINVDSFKLFGDNALTLLSTRANRSGNAGDINITARKLIIKDGGQISSSAFFEGNGGNIIVNASESIEISGQGENNSGLFGSGFLAQTDGFLSQTVDENLVATGNSGDITVNTKNLNIREGGTISVGAVNGSQGAAGNLKINASESVNIDGIGSTLLAESESSQAAGNLTVTTDRLTVTNEGNISVSATGEGAAGELKINARTIDLNNGTLTANTVVEDNENNIITLNTNNLLLQNGNGQALISTDAENTDGGNIFITTDNLVALDNSDITANAMQGRGGTVEITAQGIFGIEAREKITLESDITATSNLGVQFSGEIIINNPEIEPESGLNELPTVPIDADTLIAQNICSLEQGQIAGGSSFIIIGRGGLPPSADDPLTNKTRIVDWATPSALPITETTENTEPEPVRETVVEDTQPVIQQAQGWAKTKDGKIVLTANAPMIVPQTGEIGYPSCNTNGVADLMNET